MESREDIQSRHRKEHKDLQSKITAKKKNASKKTRKGVNSECDDLERQLKERQEQELLALNGDTTAAADVESEDSSDEEESKSKNGVNGVADSLSNTTIADPTNPSKDNDPPRKRNRQKERLARRAAEQDAAVAAAKEEAANQPDERAVEREKLTKSFTANGLKEKLIRPDGHCLFSAVADQLSLAGISLGGEADSEALKEDQRYKVVRVAAANYIEQHPDDFVPFMEEPLEQYVTKIRDTAEWGGHLELLALAKTYNVKICVLRDSGQQDIEPDSSGNGDPQKIWLAYYRHGFGLGEHYNSLRKAP